ncbi:aminotransferase class V-fold PLP-dependent enzyme [Gynuella sp.]|uniref:aminotransferase class V-fold PLP-dependent enzyme n=1 Tax=Gynuella sp. TaxID=2969146 RepID=UPI003D14BF31
MGIDKHKIRAETPGTRSVLHLNNAGSSLMTEPVLKTQLDYLRLEAEIGGYEAAALRANDLERVYQSVADLIHGQPEEIAIVENASVGWMMAFYAIPFAAGDRILTAEAEYASNYVAYLHMARIKGVQIDVIPSNEYGEVCLQALEEMLDERVKLISITHVPTNSGLVNPVAAIGAIARRHNILFLVDACQSAGHLPLDVTDIQCDILTATGRKYLRGPRGTGFLYVRSEQIARLHPPMIDLFGAQWSSADQYTLRPDARRFENWENNYAAKLGLGRAVDYALQLGIDAIAREITRLASRLRALLADLPAVELRDIGRQQCGIVSFSVTGRDALEIRDQLRAQAIHLSVSHPSSTLIDATRRQLPNLLRASVHYYNSDEELERFILALSNLLKG